MNEPKPSAATTETTFDQPTNRPAGPEAIDEFKRLLDIEHQPSVFAHPTMFAHAQRVARMLVQSSMAPDHFRGEENLGNAVVAVDIAFRLKVSPLLVMAQIYMVYGKPGFSSQFVVATINSSGKFSRLKFKIEGKDDERGCIAYAKELETGEVLESTRVDVAMAKRQGWWGKKDSKWPQMTDQMLAYRAASFWGRLYAPELLMGLQTIEELEDTLTSPTTKPLFPKEDNTKKVEQELKKPIVTAQPPPTNEPPPTPQQPGPAPVQETKAPETPAPVSAPAPSPVPEQVEPAPAPAPEPKGGYNPIRYVRLTLKENGKSEKDLIKFLTDACLLDGNFDSLEGIALAQPEVFKVIHKEIIEIVSRMNGATK